MDILEKFLYSIAYKFPKGYPDMKNKQDMLLLEQELFKYNIDLREGTKTANTRKAIDTIINSKEGKEVGLSKMANDYRIGNVNKIDKDKFIEILNSVFGSPKIKVYGPKEGPNGSSKYNMFEFDLEGEGQVQITLAGGANEGEKYEQGLLGKLQSAAGNSLDSIEDYETKQIFSTLEIDPSTISPENIKFAGASDTSRQLSFDGPKEIGTTIADIVITTPKQSYYLSIKNVGGSAITAYYAVSNPDQITSSGASSPVTVTGLANGTSYTFNVWALNSYGPGVWSAATGSVSPAAPRGLWAGGSTGSNSNIIDYITISTTGNAIDFGDLVAANRNLGGCASSTRGLFGGGESSTRINAVTIATTGNATDFGTLTTGMSEVAACNSATIGLFAGSFEAINQLVIASGGSATTFGTLSPAITQAAGCSSSTRGLFGGGSGPTNVISYVTIATAGNGTDFGDLTVTRARPGAASNSTRGVWAGGNNGGTPVNTIDYVTIATTGNATDFGDLSAGWEWCPGASSTTRAVFGGGEKSSSRTSALEYITIASTGNSTSFGNLTVARTEVAACSSGNGGTQ
jgi:hypothetical protein